MTIDDVGAARIDVEDLGEPTPSPFADMDAAALDEVEQQEERPLTDEEQRDLLAGAYEVAFGAGAWWFGRGAPEPVAAQIDAAWELPPSTSRRLGHTTLLAMPRSWRESRLLERLPLMLLAAQVGALVRIRIGATQHIMEDYTDAESRSPVAGQPLSPGGRPVARAAADGNARGAQSNGAGPVAPSPYAAGLGLGAPVSARAAERRERRRAARADGGAE